MLLPNYMSMTPLIPYHNNYGITNCYGGWSGEAKVLGKLSVPGRPTSLDNSRARAYCACSRCGWGFVWTFFLYLSFPFSFPSLWETARYRLKYCLKGPLNPKQPTNQPTLMLSTLAEWRGLQLYMLSVTLHLYTRDIKKF